MRDSASNSTRSSGRGRGGRGATHGTGVTFVSATGDPISGRRCFVCGDPSHFAKVVFLSLSLYMYTGDLKRICETDLGLISQCCLTKHVFKVSKQYLANVSLKINVKVILRSLYSFLINN